MCFSANASFGAGIILAGISIVTLKKAKQKSQILFAGIPLLFCIQQVAEGFLWLALSNPAYASVKQETTFVFLLFAQIIWAFYLPLSIFLMDKKENRKSIQQVFVMLGIIVSLYFGYCLLAYSVEAKTIGYHISYKQEYPTVLTKLFGFFYVLATITPAFFSQIKYMKYFGAFIFLSYIITKILYTDYVVSVWCFFASIISLVVLFIIYHMNKSKIQIKVA